MKITITFLLSFLFCAAQAQYSVDWGKAPLNPLPDRYTLNHFKIDGKVTSFNDVYGKTITIFNDQGKAVYQTNDSDKTTWIYDNAGHLIQQKWGDDYDLTLNYKTNDKGWIIAMIYQSGTIQTINYNQKGLFVSKMEGDIPVVKYVYDEQGRVVQAEFFYGGLPNMLDIYEYTETPEGLSVLTTHINKDTDEIEMYNQKFNKRGDMVSRNDEKQEYKYDKYGNILSSTGKDFPVKYEYVYAKDKDRK